MDDDLRELLGHGMKRGGIGISDPGKSKDRGHATSVEAYEMIVKSILGGVDLK